MTVDTADGLRDLAGHLELRAAETADRAQQLTETGQQPDIARDLTWLATELRRLAIRLRRRVATATATEVAA